MLEIILITLLGTTSAILLIIVDTIFNKHDKKLEEIDSLLPQYNCGGCGFGSCRAYAMEIKKGNIKENKCRPIAKDNLPKLKKFFK